MASNCNQLCISGSVQGNFKCTWKVEKFSSLDSAIGKSHRSEKFRVQENRMEWSLVLYPGGETENSRGCFSCFACVKSEMKDLLLKYKISILNTKDEVLFFLESKDWKVSMTRGFGNSNAIDVQDLVSKLVDDTLMVVLDVTYCSTYIKDGVGVHNCAETTPMMKMVDDFQNLRVSNKGADSKTKVHDIPFHSSIVGARLGCFSSDPKEFPSNSQFLGLSSSSTPSASCPIRVVKVSAFDPVSVAVPVTSPADASAHVFSKRTMVSLIEFAYSGSIPYLNIDLALKFIGASMKYEISDLQTYCSNYLISLLDRDNVCEILLKADRYEAKKLRSHAMKRLLMNFSEEDFEAKRSIFDSQPDLIQDIVQEFDKKKDQSKVLISNDQKL